MSPSSQPFEARRFLIAVGSPESPGLPSLPRVEHDVNRIATIFCSPKQGYQRVLAERILIGSKAQDIHDGIYDWFTALDRQSSDIVLLYFAGHGGDAGQAGNYYLFTKDTDENRLAKTALNVSAFLQELYDSKGERPQNVLLVLDACYSAKGGVQSLAALSRIRESGAMRGGTGLWVVAAADPLTEAGDGAFVRAFEAVLADPAWAPQGGAEFLNPLDVMVFGVNAQLSGEAQQAEGDLCGVRLPPLFIRNPHYTSNLDGAPLLDEGHWDPKGRGVEGLASPGWYFTGRRRVLRDLTGYLRSAVSDRKARVVTGGPGSGKSAVLGRLVMSSHPAKRQEMIAAGALDPLDETAPPAGTIRAYVHARGLTTDQIAGSLARQLACTDPTPDGVLRFLAGAEAPIGIVIDALDEAGSPAETETELLRKLADATAVRLIVGTRRRGDQVPLASSAVVLDLDDPATYFDPADVAAYVRRRLLEWDPPSSYRDPARHFDAQNLAKYVAERAGFSFLFARLVTRVFASEPASIDTSQPDWKTKLRMPKDLYQAFEIDLERFEPAARRRIVNLLIPLAYARGKGLPQKNIWATAASEISGTSYGNPDIRDVKALAGYYILQDTDEGQVVFRLFHQAFADYLKQLTRDEDVDGAFVRALCRASPGADGQFAGWDHVHDPYTLRYVCAHAAAAGRLDDLVQEPTFLTSLPPESVLPYLHCLRSADVRRIAGAYRRVSHHMRAPLMQERISYLHLAALEDGIDEFAAKLATLPLPYDWRALWARWKSTVPGEVAIESEAALSALTIREVSPDVAAVALGANGAVQLWTLPGKIQLAESQKFDGELRQIFLCETGHRHWIVGIWERSRILLERPQPGQPYNSALTVRVLEYPSCRLHAQTGAIHPSTAYPNLEAAAVGESGGVPMIAVASVDKNLSLWSVPDLQQLQMVDSGHTTDIRCMGFGVAGGRSVLLASFDTWAVSGGHCDDGILTRAWTVPALERIADHYYSSGGSAKSMVVFTVGGEQLAMIEYRSGEEFEILDMSLQVRYEQHDGAAFNLAGVTGWNNGALLYGENSGNFCFAEVTSDRESGLACRIGHTRTHIVGDMLTAPTTIHGRIAMASVDDGKRVRLWDIDEMVSSYSNTGDARVFTSSAGSTFAPEIDSIGAAAVDEASGTIIVGAQNGKIAAFDAANGDLRWAHLSQPRLHVMAAAAVDVDGRRIVVQGGSGGALRMLDIETGTGIGPPMQAGRWVCSLITQIIDGAPLCFVATDIKDEDGFRYYEVCVFDLRSGEEKVVHLQPRFGASKRLQIDAYQDKILEAVCVPLDDQGRPIVLIAGPYSFVRKWTWPPNLYKSVDLDMQEPIGNMYVKSLAAGKLAGRLVAAAGNEEGLLAVWDLKTNALLHRVESAHRGSISALAVADWFGSGALVSGGSGCVRVWSAALELMLEIDLEARIVALAPLTGTRLFVATDKGLSVLALRGKLR